MADASRHTSVLSEVHTSRCLHHPDLAPGWRIASTAITIAGGVSAKDATGWRGEMGCEPEFLHGMRKRQRHTEFACFVRNITSRPVRLTVPFGQMETAARMSEAEIEELLQRNRPQFRATNKDDLLPSSCARSQQSPSGFALGRQEIL